MVDTDRFATALLARKTHLNRALHRYEHALDREPSKDFEDRATEREDDEVLERLGAAGLAELGQIDAALERIADGSFGVCLICGEPIETRRLQIVPHAATCAGCA